MRLERPQGGMSMFGLSGWHLLLILVVALLLFGNRLPEVARSLGRSFNEFKKGLREVQDELGREEPAPGDQPQLKSPTEDRVAHQKTPAREREPVDSEQAH
jgi:sec-independent protein translocase protein TatA